MRYESALQIIGFLKKQYGTPVPILHIVDGIDLSYQPTHRHVYELKQRNVIQTAREGRHVLCHLAHSRAAHLWLAALSFDCTRRTLQRGGATAQIIARLQSLIAQPPAEGLEAVAIQPPTDDTSVTVIIITETHATDEMQKKFTARCKQLNDAPVVLTLTYVEVARRLADSLQQQSWVARSIPLYGEQRFWQTVLPRRRAAMGSIVAR